MYYPHFKKHCSIEMKRDGFWRKIKPEKAQKWSEEWGLSVALSRHRRPLVLGFWDFFSMDLIWDGPKRKLPVWHDPKFITTKDGDLWNGSYEWGMNSHNYQLIIRTWAIVSRYQIFSSRTRDSYRCSDFPYLIYLIHGKIQNVRRSQWACLSVTSAVLRYFGDEMQHLLLDSLPHWISLSLHIYTYVRVS